MIVKRNVPVAMRARNKPYNAASSDIVHTNCTHFSATRLLFLRSSQGLSGHFNRIRMIIVMQIRKSPGTLKSSEETSPGENGQPKRHAAQKATIFP